MYILPKLHHPRISRQRKGQWQAARNTAMHHYIRMQLSALAPSPPRPGHAGRHLIRALFHRAVSSAAMCRSRGPPSASSSPLGAYSSPAAAHRITPHNLTSPLYLPLSTYILVEHPPRQYAQRLDRVSGHHITREQHACFTCPTVKTHCRMWCIRVRACATPTCISKASSAALCLAHTAGMHGEQTFGID
jgi:hypothetical protein